MLKEDAKTSVAAVNSELFSLEPSTIISLFEIDTSDIAFDKGYITSTTEPEIRTVFRFHNTINFTRSQIIWNGNKYHALPVYAEGFELNSKGTLPTPKLSITVEPQFSDVLIPLKQQIKQLNNLVGSKVTRILVFAKYLDEINFVGMDKRPEGFDPDPNTEISRDVFYIDNKASENKYGIIFQLASVLSVEGLQLPMRVVYKRRCNWRYRGEGCLYEYTSRRDTNVHGDTDVSLPDRAPPIANSNNELFTILLPDIDFIDRGKYNKLYTYHKGDVVYLEKDGIKYYFLAKADEMNVSPPDSTQWIADQCAKDLQGCKYRWSSIGDGYLPFGGFPGLND